VSAFFTIIGGLTTVIWTDTVQTVLMLAGAIYLAIIALVKVDGYQLLVDNFLASSRPTLNESQSWKHGCDPSVSSNCSSCSSVNEYYLQLFRPASDPEIPWPGIAGIFVSGVWYWCTDQVIVQRSLSAKNLTHAKLGCVLAAALKIFPMFILVIPGMAARVLWPGKTTVALFVLAITNVNKSDSFVYQSIRSRFLFSFPQPPFRQLAGFFINWLIFGVISLGRSFDEYLFFGVGCNNRRNRLLESRFL